MERKVVYFEDSGAENTEATFKLVQERMSHMIVLGHENFRISILQVSEKS